MSAREQFLDLKQRITASVIGQETVVDFLLIALLANGHVLLEGLPGLAKTHTIKTLANNLESDFRRIQFAGYVAKRHHRVRDLHRSRSERGVPFSAGANFR
jgi:MoxR-like ATPase